MSAEAVACALLKIVEQAASGAWVLGVVVGAYQLPDEQASDVWEAWCRAVVGVEAARALEASATL